MDLNHLGLWMVGMSAGIPLLNALRTRSRPARGCLVVWLLLLSVVGFGWLLFRDQAGLIAGGLWLVFMLVPLLGTRMVARAIEQQRYPRARRIARLLSILHPADGWREQPDFLRATELAFNGDLAGATSLLLRVERSDPARARVARTQILRMQGDWDALSDLTAQFTDADFRAEPALIPTYLRALGECIGPDAVARGYLRFEPLLSTPQAASLGEMSRLFLFAFAGRRPLLDSLLRGPLSHYPDSVKRFWLATSDLAAGRPATALVELEKLRDAPDALARQGVERRLSRSLPGSASSLSAESRVLLDRLARRLDEESRFGDRASATASRPTATLVIIALLCLVFAVEILEGGAENPETLNALGGLWPPSVLDGDWWRPLTCTFLHFGVLHLVMNCFGLWVLGPFVERALGRVRFSIVYLLSAVAGPILAVALYKYRGGQPGFLVGASGGIMGFVGATAAVLIRGWHKEKSETALRRLPSIGLLILVQVAFDLSTPQVSFLAHTTGLITGFLVALPMQTRRGALQG